MSRREGRYRFSRYDRPLAATVDERGLNLPEVDRRWKTALGYGCERPGAMKDGGRQVAVTKDGAVCIIEREADADV